jgi:uncharacterized protein YjiS (DUF1127 family)
MRDHLGRTPRKHQELARRDTRMLHDIGLRPDDFREALVDRYSALLFTPFRNDRRK